MTLITIAELQGRLDRGETTSVALLEDLQARIAARGTLSPFQRLEWERAYQQARAADLARRDGAPLGPLQGVPMAHKDMFDRKGSTVGCGGHPSARKTAQGTAAVLDRLDAAGAVDFGRLQMSEFAMGPTGQNHHHGMPENPAVPAACPADPPAARVSRWAWGWCPRRSARTPAARSACPPPAMASSASSPASVWCR